jgi:amino acid transporter
MVHKTKKNKTKSFSGFFLFCFSSSCVPHVASFSGLFLFCFSLSCVPYFTIFSGLLLYKKQDEDKQNKNNPEKLETWGTQDEDKQNKSNPEKMVK